MTDRFLVQRLLSGKRQLTADEKKQIFENVYTKTQHPLRARVSLNAFKRVNWMAGLVSVICICLCGILFVHFMSGASSNAFTAKGTPHSPGFMIGCRSGVAQTCTHSATLGFKVTNHHYHWFAAFAIHQTSRKVIWYFPATESGTSIRVNTAQRDNGWIQDAISLGASHPFGTYEVIGIGSQRPLSRAQIRQLIDHNVQPEGDVHISKVHFTVE